MPEQDLKSTTHLYNKVKAKRLTINTFRTLSGDVIQILSQKSNKHTFLCRDGGIKSLHVSTCLFFVFLEAVRESIQKYEMVLRSEERVKSKKSGKEARGKNSKTKARTVSVTISIGVVSSEAGLGTKEAIKAADKLLYKAKESGRNCTVRA